MKARVVRVVIALALLLMLALLGNAWVLASTNPLLAVQEQTRALGWEDGSLATLAGGYRSSLLTLHAHASYAPRDPRRGREVHVAIARTTPLASWRLVDYRVER